MSLYYKPIWPGFGTRLTELIVDESAKLGHNVSIFTGRIPKNMRIEKKHGFKFYEERMGDGTVSVHRLWTPSSKHEGLLKRTIVYNMFIFQCFFKILFSRNIDLLMGLHPYPPFFISILFLAKLKKIKFFMAQGDLWPDTLTELGIIKNSVVFNFIKKLSTFSFNLADVIMPITNEIKEGMKKYSIPPSKIKVVELGTNIEIFKPINLEKTDTQFIIMYSGIFSSNYDFDIIFEAAKNLKDNSDFCFILSGAGELKNVLEEKIAHENLSNVKIEAPVKSLDDVVIKLNKADILVLGMHDNMQARTAHPSKLFEFMACGKPLVVSSVGAVKEIIEKSGGGIVVNPYDSEGFTNAILELYNSAEKRQKMSINSVEYISKNYTLEIFRKKLSILLNGLISP